VFGHVPGAPRGTAVLLYRQLLSGGRFDRVAVTTTGRHSDFVFRRTPGVLYTSRRFYVVARRRRSATITQAVQALVTVSASSTTVSPGQSVTFSGHVTPNHAGEGVMLEEQRPDGSWMLLAIAPLDAASDYTASTQLASEGTFTFRAVLGATHATSSRARRRSR
jgi:hypothetical protein